MWLYTPIGFFSITAAPNHPGALQIRGRVFDDLENLRRRVPGGENYPILSNAGTDYEYRFLAPKFVIAPLIAELVSSIDYSNFKAQITDHTRHSIYMTIWSVTGRLRFLGSRATGFFTGGKGGGLE